LTERNVSRIVFWQEILSRLQNRFADLCAPLGNIVVAFVPSSLSDRLRCSAAFPFS
jgi:hypothetical protein